MNKRLYFIKFIGILGFSFFSFVSNAQDINLTKGDTKQTLNEHSFLEIFLANKLPNKKACCDGISLSGTPIKLQNDSLSLALRYYHQRTGNPPFGQSNEYTFTDVITPYTIAVDDILYLISYKNEKSKKRRNTWAVIGGVFMLTGAATMLQAPFIDGNTNKRNLLFSGVGQLSLGVILGVSNTSKKRYFKSKDNIWRLE